MSETVPARPRIPFLFSRAVEFFLPRKYRQTQSYAANNQRLTVLLGLFALAWTPVFAVQYYLVLDTPRLTIALLGSSAVGFGILYGFRRTGHAEAMCHQACALILVTLTWLVLHTGGIDSPVMYWYLLVPMLAISILGRRRWSWMWAVLTLAAIVALFSVPDMGWNLIEEVSSREHTVMTTLSMAGLLMSVVGIFWLRNEMESWLLKSTVQTEVALRQLEERRNERTQQVLQELIAQIPQGLMIVDDDGTVTDLNPAMQELLNRPAEAIEGMAWTEILEGDELEKFFADPEQMVCHDEGAFHCADGAWKMAKIDAFRANLEGEKVLFMAVTDRSQEQEMRGRMVQMDRMITTGTLAAGVAHEINNPMAFIAANVEFLQRYCVDAGVDEGAIHASLADIKVGTARVQKIVADLNQLSRKNREPRQEVKVDDLVDSALSMVEHRVQQRATLVRDYAELPAVMADESGLAQVVLNLIVNAVQAIPEGAPQDNNITLRTGREDSRLWIEVADTGTGMSPRVQRRIFEPFYTTKGDGDGTGLGLPICQNIMRAMDGELSVSSTPGEGTTFRVTWPLALPEEPSRPSLPIPDISTDSLASRDYRIAIIDDNQLLLRSLARQLQLVGEIHPFVSATEALAALSNGLEVDAIVCDLEMPGMSGARFYEYVQQDHPELIDRLFFMTGGAFSSEALAFVENQKVTVLEKPFEIRALIEEVDKRTQVPSSVGDSV